MESSKLQGIILSVLTLINLLLGKLPRVGPIVELLMVLFTTSWSEIWDIIQNNKKVRALSGKLTKVGNKETAKFEDFKTELTDFCNCEDEDHAERSN